ncbi:hypothetical protein C9374_005790 [Naegleria lovaniensis]|uniref:Uncharacterized protein n=1 Tax=Naegleria lovaniensis TaxID=51637 RepID=A0AA88GP44_NAELO|nr:uncharacterized protein C9374_005790 [Naegleria lovaniensis]KAG2381998.1 hypothetical protein C9374_005790 [Naegleria lovaniensis]
MPFDSSSASGDGSSAIKKGLIAIGLTATTLLSYAAYKYWHAGEDENTKQKSASKSTIPNYSLSTGDEKRFESWKTFENKKLGILFKYPPTYEASLINSSHLSQIQLVDTENPHSSVVILISVEENMMNFDALEYSEQNLELLTQQAMGKVNILQKQGFYTNGNKGVEILFDIIGENSTIKAYIASISQESKCYMVQHLVSSSSGIVENFNVNLIRDIIRNLQISKPTYFGKATICKMNGMEVTFPSLFYSIRPNKETLLTIARYHKEEVVKEISIFNMGDNFSKDTYLKNIKNMRSLKEIPGSISICGSMGDVMTYSDNNEKHIDVIVKLENVYYLIASHCKEEIFEDFKAEALLAAKSLKFTEARLKDELLYENSEYRFKIVVPPNQIIHQFSHQEPVVSFLSSDTTNEELDYSKLTLEAMVSVEPAPENVTNIEQVKQTSRKLLLENPKFTILNEDISKINGHDCYTSIYTLSNEGSLGLTFMVTSILHEQKVYSISTYTLAQAYDQEVAKLFQRIHNSFQLF